MTHTTETRYLSTKDVCRRYRVVPRTLYRWRKDPNLNFPEPMVINGRNYTDDQKLEHWDLERLSALFDNKPITHSADLALAANLNAEAK